MSTVVGKEDDNAVVVVDDDDDTPPTIISSIIEKPIVDKREYRHFQIANEMDVLLISDKETDKSSAACDIFIGQLCDLQSYDGIAHFCEHMLFIGTTKYPTENAYDKYLNENGGSSNAFTDLQHTCYFFDVHSSKLDGALDRFAQCFVSPLFTQSAIEREILAVDSEHSKNLQQDMWRTYQLSKSRIISNNNKYSKFGSGNAKSLPILSIREKLLEFYQQYYRKSLKLYKLVVLGSESLDELQTMALKYFDVPEFIDDFQLQTSHDRNQLIQELYPPYNNNTKNNKVWNVPQYLKVIPISEIHAIELQFPMDSQWDNYKIKPTHYLSHLIGHEGSGSLLSLLKSKHLALELYADDNSKSTTSFLIFTIRIELTQLGYEQINEQVIPIIFAYINLLNEVGPQQWIQNELMTVADLSFQFLSKRDPMDYTCSIAGGMQQYITSQHYISGPYRIYDWDPTLVENCCKCLNPDNVLIMISSPLLLQQQESTSTSTSISTSSSTLFVEEPWYGTKYSKVIIPDEIWDGWRNIKHTNYPELKLPQINDMVATDFDLVDEIKINTITDDDDDSSDDSNNNNKNIKYPTDEPICIWDTTNTTGGEKQRNNNIGETEDGDGGFIIIPKIRLWYKPDNVFKMPKVNLLYNIASAVGMTTPETCVAMELYAELVQESINEFTYLASMAGLHCSISYNAHTGFSIQISGYNHKAHVLLEKIIDTMINLDITPSDDDGGGGGGGGGSNENGIFERIVYKLEQQYKSFLVAQPYNHAVYGSTLCLEEDAMTIESKLLALQNLNYDEVSFLSKRYWKHCCVEGLVHGNASAQHAKDISKRILNQISIRSSGSTTSSSATPGHSLDEDGNNEGSNGNKNDTEACPPPPPSSSLLLSSRRVVMFEPGTSCLYRFKEFNDSNTNSCLHYLLQMGPLELEDNATLAFLQHLIREPAFNRLRTDEQLGYIVHSSVKTSGDNIKGLLLMIQSDSYDPIYLESRVENFLLDFRTRIVQMSSEDIQTNVDAVVAGFLEKNRNLGEESARYWHVISNHSYDFRRLQKLADLVKDGMTKERVLMFYDKFVAPNSILRRKMSAQVFCNAHREKMDEEPTASSTGNKIHIVRDPAEFRRSMPFHPLPKKVNVKVVDVPV